MQFLDFFSVKGSHSSCPPLHGEPLLCPWLRITCNFLTFFSKGFSFELSTSSQRTAFVPLVKNYMQFLDFFFSKGFSFELSTSSRRTAFVPLVKNYMQFLDFFSVKGSHSSCPPLHGEPLLCPWLRITCNFLTFFQ